MLTKNELAEELKISVVTINRLLAKGLPKVKVGGQVRFIYEDVEKWLKNGGQNVKN